MRRPSFRNPLFRRRRFAGEVIILCVRWYLQFKLSYRDMAEIAKELGVLVAPSTSLCWVVRYAEDFSRLWHPFERPLGRRVSTSLRHSVALFNEFFFWAWWLIKRPLCIRPCSADVWLARQPRG